MPQTFKPRRSVLYMPGSNARALEKARTLAADAIILDLEDAVAPDVKKIAREQVCNAVKAGGFGEREVVIRVNGVDTEWGSDDLAAAIESGPDAILLPKVNNSDDLRSAAGEVGRSDQPIDLWAMIETPLAILNIADIASVADEDDVPLRAFVMGTNDLAKETGAVLGEGRVPFLPWLSSTIIAARAFDVAVIDGVYNDFRNLEGFAIECAQGMSFGMDGKTLIHPSQIEGANKTFAPSDAEVEHARAIIAAFQESENRGKGAITLDGRMVELLHRDMALKTVAIADAIVSREAGQ